jgi:hypothetical protein
MTGLDGGGVNGVENILDLMADILVGVEVGEDNPEVGG